MKAPRALTLSAVLLTLLALGLTVHTAVGTPRALAQLARRHGDLLQLHGLSEHNAGNRKALATYEATADGAPDLAAWSDASPARHVVYSSCNVATLARDLAAMPSLRAVTGRVFDMFPQTPHTEVMVLLERTATPS